MTARHGETINGLALCSGIAGIDLGLSIALGQSYRTVCHVERDAYAAATLVARMEDAALDAAPVWDNLKTFDGRRWRGVVDIVTAGYPCQPFSLAGKRLGVLDERHLWPDVFRIIGEVQPGCVFLENVAAHLTMGYAEVERDLQGLGYRVKPGLFTAEEAGAPHGRKRLFILAYRADNLRQSRPAGMGEREAESEGETRERNVRERDRSAGNDGPCESCTDVAYRAESRSGELPGGPEWGPGGDVDGRIDGVADADGGGRDAGASGEGWEAESVAGHGVEGLGPYPPGPGDHGAWADVLARYPMLAPAIAEAEAQSSVCPVVDGVSARVDQLRCLGNAVVPDVAAVAFVRLAAKLGIGIGKQPAKIAA